MALTDAHKAKIAASVRAYYGDPARRQDISRRTKAVQRSMAEMRAEIDQMRDENAELRAEVERLRDGR